MNYWHRLNKRVLSGLSLLLCGSGGLGIYSWSTSLDKTVIHEKIIHNSHTPLSEDTNKGTIVNSRTILSPPENNLNMSKKEYTYSEQDVADYLGSRFIHLFADLRNKDNDSETVVKGSGFILGPASEETMKGKENVYYLGVDLQTYSSFSNPENTVTPFYAFQPFDDNKNGQKFWRLSIDNEWSWAALGIPFVEKSDDFKKKPDSQLSSGFGVFTVDLDPSKNLSRSTGRNNSPSKSKLDQTLLTTADESNLNKIRESFKKYGDVTFIDQDITDGYMHDQKDSSGTHKAKKIDDLGNKGMKRAFDENDKVTIKSRDPNSFSTIISTDYWFPVYDYQVDSNSDLLGSPLVTWMDNHKDSTPNIKLIGFVTREHNNKGLITQIIRKGDYNPISISSTNKSLCDKIKRTSSPTTWLRGLNQPLNRLRVPEFCN